MRSFGRGLDEKTRKKRIRRFGSSERKVKGDETVAAAKVKFCLPFYLVVDYLFPFLKRYRIDPTKTLNFHRLRTRY
jgi:hypothetical protein